MLAKGPDVGARAELPRSECTTVLTGKRSAIALRSAETRAQARRLHDGIVGASEPDSTARPPLLVYWGVEGMQHAPKLRSAGESSCSSAVIMRPDTVSAP